MRTTLLPVDSTEHWLDTLALTLPEPPEDKAQEGRVSKILGSGWFWVDHLVALALLITYLLFVFGLPFPIRLPY